MKLNKINPNIGLTDFISFVNQPGAKKITKIDSILNREEYHPKKDYYKKLRDRIVQVTRSESEINQEKLAQVLDEISPKKTGHYEILIKGYLKFLRGKNVTWIDPPISLWKHNDLIVRINPEIGLDINGQKTAVKLYFKKDKIDIENINMILSMMKDSFDKKDFVPAILDVRRGKIMYITGSPSTYKVFIENEATLFSKLMQDLLAAA